MITYTDEQALGYLVLGYLVMALRSLNKDEKEIRETISKVKDKMEFWTEQYAEEEYEEFI